MTNFEIFSWISVIISTILTACFVVSVFLYKKAKKLSNDDKDEHNDIARTCPPVESLIVQHSAKKTASSPMINYSNEFELDMKFAFFDTKNTA